MLLRSFMFLPAYNCKFIDKALESDADAIILDMEDSVPYEKRAEARTNIIKYANAGKLLKKPTFVRINPIETDDFLEDISTLVLNGIYGFMPSKIYDEKEIFFIDKLITLYEKKNNIEYGKIKLAPLIETTKSIDNLSNIGKSSNRLIALCFGGEDYLNDLGSLYTYQETAFVYPRAKIVNVARANNLIPIDTPYINIPDLKGFENATDYSYKNGFGGCLVLNPKQIAVANKMYMPNEEKIDQSLRIMEAINDADEGSSIVMLDGGMIGPPMRKRAENVIKQMKQINK